MSNILAQSLGKEANLKKITLNFLGIDVHIVSNYSPIFKYLEWRRSPSLKQKLILKNDSSKMQLIKTKGRFMIEDGLGGFYYLDDNVTSQQICSFFNNLLVRNLGRRLAPDFDIIHASAVGFNNMGACLLAGNPGAGKSTLALHLASRGFKFFSDDLTIINIKTNMVYPFITKVSVDYGSDSFKLKKNHLRNPISGKVSFDIEDYFKSPWSNPLPLKILIFITVTNPQLSIPKIISIRPHIAFSKIFETSLRTNASLKERIKWRSRFIYKAGNYELIRGEVKKTVDLVESLLRKAH